MALLCLWAVLAGATASEEAPRQTALIPPVYKQDNATKFHQQKMEFITLGQSVGGLIDIGSTVYWGIQVPIGASKMTVRLIAGRPGDAMALLKFGSKPKIWFSGTPDSPVTDAIWNREAWSKEKPKSDLVIDHPQTGVWYVAVHNWQYVVQEKAPFDLKVDVEAPLGKIELAAGQPEKAVSGGTPCAIEAVEVELLSGLNIGSLGDGQVASLVETNEDHADCPNCPKISPMWADVHKHPFFDAFDGRGKDKILATPGGDLAEFIVALSVFEKQANYLVTRNLTVKWLSDYLTTSPKEKFFLSTTESAMYNLTQAVNCSELEIQDPEPSLLEPLRQAIIQPENVGCPHLKLMLLHSDKYKIPRSIVELGIVAFHEIMWDKSSPLSDKAMYMMRSGPKGEKAWVDVEGAEECLAQKHLAPLISNKGGCNGTSFQVFINHPKAAEMLRQDVVKSLVAKVLKRSQQSNETAPEAKLLEASMLAAVNEKAALHQQLTMDELMQGRPIYKLYLKEKGSVDARKAEKQRLAKELLEGVNKNPPILPNGEKAVWAKAGRPPLSEHEHQK